MVDSQQLIRLDGPKNEQKAIPKVVSPNFEPGPPFFFSIQELFLSTLDCSDLNPTKFLGVFDTKKMIQGGCDFSLVWKHCNSPGADGRWDV